MKIDMQIDDDDDDDNGDDNDDDDDDKNNVSKQYLAHCEIVWQGLVCHECPLYLTHTQINEWKNLASDYFESWTVY